MAAAIDLDRPGKYPIVLSDALLRNSANNAYTGIRYNHKPDPPSDDFIPSAELKPSSDASSSNFDLGLTNNIEEDYAYTGARTMGDGQYVLIFDPIKKHFVLDRIDSTFEMNLTSTPWTDDESVLQSQYTQLEAVQGAKEEPKPKAPPKKTPKGKNTTATKAKAAPRAKADKAKKAKPPLREPTPEPEDDSDDGLTVEYPDGPPSQQQYEYRTAPIIRREPSEEMSDEDEDADGEHEIYEERNQDVEVLKLPSPVNNHGGLSDEDIELDLEAELEQALAEENADTGADSSSESEEE